VKIGPLPLAAALGSLVALRAFADTASPSPSNPLDWLGLIKDAGAVGICVWLLFYFQGRSKEDKQDLKSLAERHMQITERAVSALEKNAEGYRELAMSIQHLSERIGR
jgi:hypothetical protein